METIYSFEAILQSTGKGGGVFVSVPLDVEAVFGTKGQVKIQATIDGEPYRGILANMGFSDGKHCLGVLKEIRTKIGKAVGDSVQITVQLDTAPREVEVPEDLQKVLEDEGLWTYYQELSYTNRKEWARWISEAKRSETREKRLILAIEKMKAGKKNPTM